MRYLIAIALFLTACNPAKKLQKMELKYPEVVLEHCVESYKPTPLERIVKDSIRIFRDTIEVDCDTVGIKYVPIEQEQKTIYITEKVVDNRYQKLYEIEKSKQEKQKYLRYALIVIIVILGIVLIIKK